MLNFKRRQGTVRNDQVTSRTGGPLERSLTDKERPTNEACLIELARSLQRVVTICQRPINGLCLSTSPVVGTTRDEIGTFKVRCISGLSSNDWERPITTKERSKNDLHFRFRGNDRERWGTKSLRSLV
jgi:hypothetical protein